MKNNKGITLIALIITIIVMLILVMVTVAFAMNGGLFTKAKKASDDYIVAQEKEKIMTAMATWKGIEYSTQEKTFVKCLEDELPEADIEQIDEEGIQARVTFRDSGHVYKVTSDGTVMEDKSFTITFVNGGTLSSNQKTSGADGEIVALLAPTRDDAYFEGWYADSELTESITQVEIQGNTTVYGKWTDETPADYFEFNETGETLTGIKEEYKSQLTEVAIPSKNGNVTVTTIGERAFQMCQAIEKVYIPDTVTTLENNAFNSCSGIKELTMPISIRFTSPSGGTWGNCYQIEKVHFTVGTGQNAGIGYSYTSSQFSYTPWYFSRDNLTTVIFDEGITRIGDYTFMFNSKVTTMELPSTIQSIGEHAFHGCNVLNLTNSINRLSANSVTYGREVFRGCLGISGDITMNTTIIPDLTFSGCTNITGITLSDSVNTIGVSAFNGCTSLESITFNGVTYNSKSAFKAAFEAAGGTINGDYTFDNTGLLD